MVTLGDEPLITPEAIARLVDEMIPPDPATAAPHPMSTPAPLPAGFAPPRFPG